MTMAEHFLLETFNIIWERNKRRKKIQSHTCFEMGTILYLWLSNYSIQFPLVNEKRIEQKSVYPPQTQGFGEVGYPEVGHSAPHPKK